MPGLFSIGAPPKGPAPEDDDSFDVNEDSLPAGDEDDAPTDSVAGPFDAYAETIFDAKADTATKADALRQAIETILEERGLTGGAPRR